MASFTLSKEDTFPNGTSVSAYALVGEGRTPTSGAPSGSVVASGTVSGGSVTFSGLADSTLYFAYAASPDRYVRFSTPPPLETAQSGSGLPSNVLTKTANFTAAAGDFILADGTGGAFTITLPAAPATGACVTVKKTDVSANAIAVAASGGGTIDGDAGGASITGGQLGAVFEHVGSNAWKIVSVTAAGGQGSAGPQGATGATGAAGATGATGSNGLVSQIQDEGSNVTTRATWSFEGAGVTVTDGTTKNVITISGGGGGSGVDRLNGVAAPCDPRHIDATVVIGSDQLYGCRVVIPKTGTLRNLYVFMTATSGNLRGAVYDTGQAASTVRTRLYDSGSVAAIALVSGAGVWQPIGDPNLAVTAGDQLDLAVECDNNTVSLGRFPPMLSPAQATLPTGFFPSAVTPRLNWRMKLYPVVFADGAPATLSDTDVGDIYADGSVQGASIFIMGRIV